MRQLSVCARQLDTTGPQPVVGGSGTEIGSSRGLRPRGTSASLVAHLVGSARNALEI